MDPTICAIDGCDKEVLARGWCSRHYWRWKRSGDPLVARPKLPTGAFTVCTIDGCDRPHWSHGFCEMHSRRVRDKGEPGPAAPIKNRERTPKQPCDVEGCDRLRRGRNYCHLHEERLRRYGDVGSVAPTRVKGSGTATKEGYRRMWSPDGRRVMEHVLVMEEHLGRRLFAQENVHHRNGLVADNRLDNLELWVKTQPCGQRVSDLIEFIVKHYRDDVLAALSREDL